MVATITATAMACIACPAAAQAPSANVSSAAIAEVTLTLDEACTDCRYDTTNKAATPARPAASGHAPKVSDISASTPPSKAISVKVRKPAMRRPSMARRSRQPRSNPTSTPTASAAPSERARASSASS